MLLFSVDQRNRLSRLNGDRNFYIFPLPRMNFSDILFAALPVFLIVGVGYLTRIAGFFNDHSEKSLMRVIVNVLYPCFILSKVPGNGALEQPKVVVVAIAAGFCLTVIGLLVAKGFGFLSKLNPEDGVNTFCVATAIQNYSFLPIPLIMALFPESSDETLGVLFVHNLGLELAMWTIGIVLLSGAMSGALRRLINGPTIAISVGLLLNFTGLHAWIPEFVGQAISQLGNCSIPISLVLVGATLAGVIEREKMVFNSKVITGSLMVRFLVMPLVFLLTASAMTFSPELKRVLIVESAMPAAIFPIVLAKHFGGTPSVAVQVCVATSIACLIMTPLLLMFGLNWFGMSP